MNNGKWSMESGTLSRYDDIIHLPRPVSKKHSPMSNYDRAAQFSPFAALTGYDAVIAETGRLTDTQAELDELLLKERPARLVLELSHVEFMDSAGLGLLMGRLRLMRDIGGVMALTRPNERIMKILRLSGMERFMEIEGEGAKGDR